MSVICTYCKGPVDVEVYTGTCLSCVADLMRPFTDNVIFRRIAIVWNEHGESVAKRLCEAIERARSAC